MKILELAKIAGETTGSGANPSNKPHSLGSGFDAFTPNGQAANPITRTNWEGVGVAADLQVEASDALLTAYKQALNIAKSNEVDSQLQNAHDEALKDFSKALRSAGFDSF